MLVAGINPALPSGSSTSVHPETLFFIVTLVPACITNMSFPFNAGESFAVTEPTIMIPSVEFTTLLLCFTAYPTDINAMTNEAIATLNVVFRNER